MASTSVYSSEIPTKPPGTLTHPLTLANQVSESTGPSSRLSSLDFRRPPTSVDCLVLPTALFCPLLLSLVSSLLSSLLFSLWPSFPRPLPTSWEISSSSPLSGFRTKTDKGIFWLALTHTHRNKCHLSCHISINHLFGLGLKIKQFFLTHRYDPIKYYHSKPEKAWERRQWRLTPHSSKLQYY